LLERGARDDDEMLLVEASYVRGIVAYWQGEFEDARQQFETAVDRYRPEQRHAHLIRYGLDPKVVCQSRLGNTLWFLGYPEAAIRARDGALALADEIGHPFSRATALTFAAILSLETRDMAGLRANAAMLAVEHAKHRMKPTDVATEVFTGYLDVLDGRVQVGLSRLQRALDETRQRDHAPGMRAHSVRILLAACAAAGDDVTGLATADWELGLDDAHRIWEAETRRLRAEFLAALGAPAAEIDAELKRALAVAHRQGAKSLELRAATSRFHHLLVRGDPAAAAARGQLAAIVNSLPERIATPDLRDALDLLGLD
jgi:tetratricopeptide (TPR) repeat protein